MTWVSWAWKRQSQWSTTWTDWAFSTPDLAMSQKHHTFRKRREHLSGSTQRPMNSFCLNGACAFPQRFGACSRHTRQTIYCSGSKCETLALGGIFRRTVELWGPTLTNIFPKQTNKRIGSKFTSYWFYNGLVTIIWVQNHHVANSMRQQFHCTYVWIGYSSYATQRHWLDLDQNWRLKS